ncbi:MAG: hypothetical protein V4608_01325 [Bacteroidota bacterium]
MQNFYLIDFLKKTGKLSPELLSCLRFDLNQNIYYYGNQFKYPSEANFQKSLKSNIRKILKRLFIRYKIFQNKSIPTNKKLILSNAYFTVNQELKELNYHVYCPSWSMSADRNVLSDFKLFTSSEKIKDKIQSCNFNELISSEFLSELKKFEEELKLFFEKIKLNALFVPNDAGFFESMAIHVCKQINVPSFVFLHGLPGRYNNIDDNKADYLIVWGEKIKEHYIDVGINPDKIFVSGHPYYKGFKQEELKFSLNNILIITKAMPGSQHSDKVRLNDRGNSVLYLYAIEEVLKRMGVKSVRFRPHPSESSEWYLKFINKEFYKADTDSLKDSIEKSSLVIGPTSTVFLESIYYGINYVVFEPSVNDIDLINYELVPPFDGTKAEVPVAKNEQELEYILKNKTKVNASFFSEYIKTPFDLSFINKLIK